MVRHGTGAISQLTYLTEYPSLPSHKYCDLEGQFGLNQQQPVSAIYLYSSSKKHGSVTSSFQLWERPVSFLAATRHVNIILGAARTGIRFAQGALCILALDEVDTSSVHTPYSYAHLLLLPPPVVLSRLLLDKIARHTRKRRVGILALDGRQLHLIPIAGALDHFINLPRQRTPAKHLWPNDVDHRYTHIRVSTRAYKTLNPSTSRLPAHQKTRKGGPRKNPNPQNQDQKTHTDTYPDTKPPTHAPSS